MKYSLYRKKRGTNAWCFSTSGDIDYIMEVLKLHLLNIDLAHFEWKVEVN